MATTILSSYRNVRPRERLISAVVRRMLLHFASARHHKKKKNILCLFKYLNERKNGHWDPPPLTSAKKYD